MTDPNDDAMEIIAFLMARIRETEMRLHLIVSRREAFRTGVISDLGGTWTTYGEYGRMIREAFQPELMLAEIRAKRERIMLHPFTPAPDMWRPLPEELPADYVGNFIGWCDLCSHADLYAPWPCESLRLEAAPFIDRHGFNLAWRIDTAN